MYKKSVRRRRVVLALLVGLSIALLTAYFGESASGGLHSIQRGFLEVLSPLQEGASRALKPVRDFGGWVGDVFDAKSDNKKLRKQVQQLRAQLAAQQTNGSDGGQVKALVAFNKSGTFPSGYKPLPARVIARSPTVWYSTITINQGSDSGVRRNQPVVTGDGLAGRISDVSPDAAQVTLITDHSSGVSAQVVPNGANGLIKATVGNPNDLILDFVQKNKQIKKGATVITSGWRSSNLESLFPRGIPIGSVKSVDATERELFQRVHVSPFANVRDASVVEVLLPTDASGQRAQVLP